MERSNHLMLLAAAIEEARRGLAEGGIPIGAALFDAGGRCLGSGRNRRVQDGDPSAHGETDAFRKAGRQRSYRDKVMVTTLAPCWYCSGLIRQFGIGTVIVGESVNFRGGIDWLRENEDRSRKEVLRDLEPAQRVAGLMPELVGVKSYQADEFKEKVEWMMARGFLTEAPDYTEVVRSK